MKKIIILILAAILLLALVACDDKTPEDDGGAGNTVDPEQVFDFIVQKDPGKDFVILNLSDPQMYFTDWYWNKVLCRQLLDTIDTLITTVQPDLITIAGDITQDGKAYTFTRYIEFFDSYEIPWALVLGNHDYQYASGDTSAAPLPEIMRIYETQSEYCIFKAGPEELGYGNYTIGIEENGKIVSSIFMIDTHSDLSNNQGINTAQLEWYKTKVEEMKSVGCNESMAIFHIPTGAFGRAAYNAIPDLEYHESLPVQDTHQGIGWAEGYAETSFGHSDYVWPDAADLFFDLVKELGHTTNIIAGHDHHANFSIIYEGVRFTHGLKTGCTITCDYEFDRGLNGGTVITVTSNGIGLNGVRHEYVPIQDYITKDDLNKLKWEW